jgi:uncharacterized membrane protein
MTKLSFNKYPIDIVLCLLCSLILLPITLLNTEGPLRVILGILFILFIPGYIFVFALFPTRKTDHGIDVIERIALSFCLSVAIVPLVGLALNFTPWGIQLDTILLSMFICTTGIGVLAIYRWIKTVPEERFIITINITSLKSNRSSDKVLNVILVIFIIIIVVLLVYVIIVPKTGEKFTEFYLLDSKGMVANNTTYLTVGENMSVTLGIVNHESRIINYTIDVWLINQTTVFNEITLENETVYNHMWFINKINVILNPTYADIEKRWEPQWEYNFNINITRQGNFKMAFLLFLKPTENYNYSKDYEKLTEEKINNAYRETHLWVTVV